MRYLFLLLIFISQMSFAICDQRMAFLGGGWSKHFVARGHGKPSWTEDHHASIYECNSHSFAAFTNSQGHEGYGYGRLFGKEKQLLDFSLYMGVWSGYEEGLTPAGFVPVMAVRGDISLKRLEINTWLTPIVSVVTIGWKI